MLTLIFDIDGTLTNLWPIEKSVLAAMLGCSPSKLDNLKEQIGNTDLLHLYQVTYSKKQKLSLVDFRRKYQKKFYELLQKSKLPKVNGYKVVDYIKANPKKCKYLYATASPEVEAEYVLKNLGILEIFDRAKSSNQNSTRFSKKSGLPFKKLKQTNPDCLLITDSMSDIDGAKKAGIGWLLLKKNERLTSTKIKQAQRNSI